MCTVVSTYLLGECKTAEQALVQSKNILSDICTWPSELRPVRSAGVTQQVCVAHVLAEIMVECVTSICVIGQQINLNYRYTNLFDWTPMTH